MNKKAFFQYSLAVVCFVAGCHVSQRAQEPMKLASTSFDSQGHRGSRGLMPENTWPAMRAALDLGVTTLEMDVVITKDRQVVVSHDTYFNHEISTKPNGEYVTAAEEKALNIFEMTYEEVRKYDVGMKPHPKFPRQQKLKTVKPLLRELLQDVETYMTTSRRPLPYFNIETKSRPETDNLSHPGPEEFVELLMAVIKEMKLESRVIIQSFDFRTLQYLHKKYPHIQTAALIEPANKRGLASHLMALGFNPDIYSPGHQLVTPELVKECHDKKIRIIPWTVNTKEDMERIKGYGVDGIISDYPDLF